MVIASVTNPQRIAIRGEARGVPAADVTFPFTRSPTALPARESPIRATVGPITAAGISLETHFTPAILTTIAITT